MLRALVNLVFFGLAAFVLLLVNKMFGYWALAGLVALLGLCWLIYRAIYGHWPDEADWAQPDSDD